MNDPQPKDAKSLTSVQQAAVASSTAATEDQEWRAGMADLADKKLTLPTENWTPFGPAPNVSWWIDVLGMGVRQRQGPTAKFWYLLPRILLIAALWALALIIGPILQRP